MTLLAFGLNHTTAPVEIRERVTIGDETLPTALSDLTESAGVEEAAILSTCNRTEIYCSLEHGDRRLPIDWFLNFHDLGEAALEPYLYTHPDASAVKHVLRVASGLDSMVLGEPQVLGQLKSAYRTALQAGSIGQLLSRLFQHSFHVAKQIRSNTAIGSHPVSVAFAAVRLAQQIFGDLSDQTVLLIGAGETIELTAKHLRESGMQRMIIANRTLERSQRLALEYSGYAITMEDLPQHLDEADIIIASTSSPVPILNRNMVEAALEKRRHRPVFIVDIAVPRDVEPAVGKLNDVYLYTVDDLQDVIEENIRSRREAARQAEQIIDSQVMHFMEWLSVRDSVSTIRAIRDQASAIQQQVFDSALQRLRHGENPEQLLEEVTRTLTNKLIHSPSARLRNTGGLDREDLLKAARELFGLPSDPQDGHR
jgi:glutamyl-tRNA reductase